MSPPVFVLLLLAGLSEAAGRVLPLVARRTECSRTLMVGLLLVGALIEAAVIALWPLTARALVELVSPVSPRDSAGLMWTPGLIAPLLVAAVLAFPLLGPLLHLIVFAGVGVGVAGALSAATGVRWGAALFCVAAAGVGLALAVELVRRLVARVLAIGVPEPTA